MKSHLLCSAIVAFGSMSILSVGCGGGGAGGGATADSSTLVKTISINDSLLRVGASDSIDLGRIRAGEVIQGELSIVNTGNRPFVILGIETSCGCAQIDYPRCPLTPKECGLLTYRYDSQGQSGWQLKLINILTSLQQPAYKLYITAEVD